ncbi:MAG: membrane protein insertase YidC [Flavobacteriales bacterium]|nr:membrane protein insertase YidC [Flavobacteriales bacterium]
MLLGQDNNAKMDTGSLVGFVIVMVLTLGYFWYTAPSQEEIDAARVAQEEQVAAEEAAREMERKSVEEEALIASILDSVTADSTASEIPAVLLKRYGDFAYGAMQPYAQENTLTTLENDTLRVVVSSKGGMPVEVELKGYKTYDKTPLYLIKDGNADFNMTFYTVDGRMYDTRDLFFEPVMKEGGKVLSMRAKVSADDYLEYRYTLRDDEYMLGFDVASHGLGDILKNAQQPVLDWKFKAFHTEKGIKYENNYTNLTFATGAKCKVDDLAMAGSDDDTVEDLTWLAFKQSFFSTILLTDSQNKATVTSRDVYEEDSLYTKAFTANVQLPVQNGDFNVPMQLYFGPNAFHTLDSYGHNLDEILPLGWAIFRWINRWVIIPMFDLLYHHWALSMWLVILIMTVVMKGVLTFFTYSSYKSQAKMRLLKPEMQAINEKFKDADPAKKQQEIMNLYSQAGVNPLAGCLPALLQMPILIAMYRFFPAAIELRGESFLWAEDLSAYDSILDLPFNIPGFGSNVSLFALLMAVTMFLSVRTSSADMNQQTQPGMPNMKFILYLMPVMMIFWFNTAASGLSYYYALFSLISIVQMWAVKKFFVSDEKVLATLEKNRANAKAKGPSKWQRKMDEMMKEAQAEQNRRARRMK